MMSPTAQEAFDRIVALKELTTTAKIYTYKSQAEILKALNPTDLAEVALALKSSGTLSTALSREGSR
jgi:hypothetical protein